VLALALTLGLPACGERPLVVPPHAPAGLTSAVEARGQGEVEVGAVPPDFVAIAHDGTEVRLSALAGRPVVLWFYSKDETPGAVREASDFRDAFVAFAARGAVPNTYGILGRQTFVVGAGGTLERIYRTVELPGHAADVLESVEGGAGGGGGGEKEGEKGSAIDRRPAASALPI